MTETEKPANQVVIVSGLSGAGKSTALRQFEDMGWEIADNVPLALLQSMVRQSGEAGGLNLALGVDFRTRGFSTDVILELIRTLREIEHDKVRLLFLDCDEAVLQRRFTETRRRHPLAADRPVGDGIRQEIQQLSSLREVADLRIDSTNLSLPELKRILSGHFSLQQASRLSVSVMSFSYKYGVPREADLMFDVRFLRNPFYEPSLADKTGEDAAVIDFIARDPAFAAFMEQLSALLSLLLPRYAEEGKSYLTIAFGCTGGRHRSVCIAEKIHDLVAKSGYFANLAHRDLPIKGRQ
ncbi:RNase adapter RapZ [Sneathiella sp.]|uniref:RNase adapter RapZ n=1 Tax=Sneathiella sp. TaxID=1964365 RepID=UPI00356167EE